MMMIMFKVEIGSIQTGFIIKQIKSYKKIVNFNTSFLNLRATLLLYLIVRASYLLLGNGFFMSCNFDITH